MLKLKTNLTGTSRFCNLKKGLNNQNSSKTKVKPSLFLEKMQIILSMIIKNQIITY